MADLRAACVLLLSTFVVAMAARAADPATSEELRPGAPVTREISGARADRFSVSLGAGEAADVTVDQRGMDVVVRVSDSGGNLLIENDLDARPDGREEVTVVADEPVTWVVIVSPRYVRVPPGEYVIELGHTRTPAASDRARFDAAKEIRRAFALNAAGKLEDARLAAENSLAIAAGTLDPADPYVGYLLQKFANINRLLGRYDEAKQQFERAIAIAEAALGPEHLQTSEAKDWLALTCMAMNDFVRAERLLIESRDAVERSLGPEHPALMGRLQDLAILYQNLEDTGAAVALLEKALRIAEASIDPDDFQFVALVNNIGTLHRELRDYERATPLLERSLAMVEKKFGPEHPHVATPLQELAIIARETGEFDNALSLLWRADAAREKALGYRHQSTMATLIVIANVYLKQGEYERARVLLENVLSVLEEIAGPYHNLTLLTLVNLAKTHTAAQNAGCALEFTQRMNRVLEKNLELKLAIGSERQKLEYARAVAERTDRTISLQAGQAAGLTAAAEEAVLVLLQRKGRVLDALARNRETLRGALDATGQEEFDQLARKTSELAKVALSGPGKTPVSEYRERLSALEREKEALEARISAISGPFHAERMPVTLDSVRSQIPPSAALVEFAVYRSFEPRGKTEDTEYGPPRYIAYVILRDGPLRWKDLGEAKTIDGAVDAWRRALRDPARSDVGRRARAVDRMIIEPLRPLFGGASHLLIAPDGQLALIPFEALVDRAGRHLVESFSITYLGSGRDLLRMSVPRQVKSPPLLIADPAFGAPAPHMQATSRSSTHARVSTMFFGPLVATREEARSIKALFPDAVLLTGKEASKSALRDVVAPQILHVATHGFFLAYGEAGTTGSGNGTRSVNARAMTPNPLLRSGLALSGANLSAQGIDEGVLTALEASMLDLWGTQLVTLSACDSGVGEVTVHEGIYGLRRAFSLAGAETVVMSLWPVSDYVTRQMMTAYYSGLSKGLGRGEALRQAQLAIRKRDGKGHPFYWASFIQSGNWRPLE